MTAIRLTKAGQGEHFLAATDVVTLKCTSKDTSDTMLLVEVRVPAGGGPPVLHRHASAKIFYFLEGTFQIATLDAQNRESTLTTQPGDTVAIPAMVWHNLKNVGTTPGFYLGIHSPTLLESFVRELGQPIEDPLHPPKPAAPPSLTQQQMMATITKYMEVLPSDQLHK